MERLPFACRSRPQGVALHLHRRAACRIADIETGAADVGNSLGVEVAVGEAAEAVNVRVVVVVHMHLVGCCPEVVEGNGLVLHLGCSTDSARHRS
jgi:hypothetical protein